MRSKWIRLVVFLPMLLASFSADARLIVYGKGRDTISIAFGVETILRFPMEVKTITEASRFEIRPANQDEPDYSVLVVKPRMSEGAADVTFILADGTVIKTQLVISARPNLKRDSIYDFKPKVDLGSTNPNLPERHDPMVISELDLMRAMIRGDEVAGFDLGHYSLPIETGSTRLSAALVKRYLGKELVGYIYLLKVPDPEGRFEIDLKALAIGNPNLAILSQIDRRRLGGSSNEERETFLRIVAKPGDSSRKIILPVAIRSESTSKEGK